MIGMLLYTCIYDSREIYRKTSDIIRMREKVLYGQNVDVWVHVVSPSQKKEYSYETTSTSKMSAANRLLWKGVWPETWLYSYCSVNAYCTVIESLRLQTFRAQCVQ